MNHYLQLFRKLLSNFGSERSTSSALISLSLRLKVQFVIILLGVGSRKINVDFDISSEDSDPQFIWKEFETRNKTTGERSMSRGKNIHSKSSKRSTLIF